MKLGGDNIAATDEGGNQITSEGDEKPPLEEEWIESSSDEDKRNEIKNASTPSFDVS